MTTTEAGPARPAILRPPARRPDHNLARVVLGLIVVSAGVGLLAEQAGADVPWHLWPAAALVVTGLALVVTRWAGSGRGELIGLGAGLTILSLLVQVSGADFTGPVGDRTLAPPAAAWPVESHLSAGTLTIDLTRNPLPAAGLLTARVGAGTIKVLLPQDLSPAQAPVIDGQVGAGQVSVDGVIVRDGLDVQWSSPSGGDPALRLDLTAGAGTIEVRHV